MALISAKPTRDTLTLHLSAEERDLIDRAASSTGKTRKDFILNAARRAAEDALLDRALILVRAKAHRTSPRPNKLLKQTMQRELPWAKA